MACSTWRSPETGPSSESGRSGAGHGGVRIPSAEKADRKLKRLRQIEAGYRAEIRRAQQSFKGATVDRVKAERRFEKIRAKIEAKIEKVQPKIRALTNLKAERKAGRREGYESTRPCGPAAGPARARAALLET